MTLINPRTGTSEKIGRVYMMQGKKNIEAGEISCGDIGQLQS
jgi:elongation factor G